MGGKRHKGIGYNRAKKSKVPQPAPVLDESTAEEERILRCPLWEGFRVPNSARFALVWGRLHSISARLALAWRLLALV